MDRLSFFGRLKMLKTDLAGMSHKDKLIHIWTYYKWVIPVLLVLIMLLSVVITAVTNINTVKMMGGISINVDLGDAGETYLREDYKEQLGLTSKRQTVVFTETIIEDPEKTSNFTNNYYAMMSVIALCTNQEVDYLIMDEIAVKIMAAQGAFLDLREQFSQEELDAMGDRVTYIEDEETKEKIPAVLNITDTPFIQQYAPNEKNVFFGFVVNSTHKEETKALYEYLLAWKAE